MAEVPSNPYRLHPDSVLKPPQRFFSILGRIGPGLILTSTIVGSGELVATTVLGAEQGYALLWLILVSCVVKIVVQNELGRYAIGTGETTLEAFDKLPGPRWRVSWVVWLWFLVVLLGLFSIGGMLGGVSEVLSTLVPDVSFNAWLWFLNLFTIGLLVVGRYSLIERVAVAMVVTFTLLTVGCAYLLSKDPQYFTWARVLEGLSFRPPQGGMSTAVTVFGATGVGAIELIAYPYWCIEKGYARFTGIRERSQVWKTRAEGWIKVMGADVLSACVIYTFATVAFYFLGAGVLSEMGLVPKGPDMVRTLAHMFTQTLGPWSYYLFLIGAMAVLYSTVFSGIAALSRMLADFAGMLGLYRKDDYGARLKAIRLLVVGLPLIPTLLFLYVQEPVLMIKVSGISQALLLPGIGFAILYLGKTWLPREIAPGNWITAALWGSTLVMALMMGYSVVLALLRW